MHKHLLLSLLLVTLILLSPVVAAAVKAPPIQANFTADEIAEDVYVIHGPIDVPTPENQGFMNNPGFIITEEGVIVVDPGGSVQTGEMVLGHIRKITDKPVIAIFNTHVHGDHWLANQAFRAVYPGVAIYAHPKMIDEVKAGAGDSWMMMAMRMTDGAVAGTDIVNAEIPVDNGDSLLIGGLHFNVYHNGPAHTLTDIMIHVPQKQVMFLGDNASVNRVIRNEGSIKGNIAALDEAMSTQTRIFVPGHGPSGPEGASQYREYLASVYRQVRTQYENGLSDFEIKPVIIDNLKKWNSWSDFGRVLGKHVHSIYFEIEADEF